MRKIFFTLICLIAVTISAYAQENVPEPIRILVQVMRDECDECVSDKEIECGGVKISGHDIVITYLMDESDLEGMTIKQLFEVAGYTDQELANLFRNEFFSELTDDDKVEMAILSTYKYNLLFHLVGKQSKEEMNCRINYWEFATKK